MENQLEIYNKLKQPPAAALKQITGGRLSGMTDIKPQWRFEIMTETFGLCGFGWKYVIKEKRFESGSENQVACFVDIDLFVKIKEEWSEAIPGTGGSSFVAKEKNGMYTSDEAIKMALTDALSVAMKAIGVAADIYMGSWTGSKYKDQPVEPKQPVKKASTNTSKVFEDNLKNWDEENSRLDEILLNFEIECETWSNGDDMVKAYNSRYKVLKGVQSFDKKMKELKDKFNNEKNGNQQ